MDEIKFKAWDKSLKEMRNDFLGKSGDGKADWILFFEPGTTDSGKRIDGINNPFPRERFVLLQFTGLYDKNKTPEHPKGVPIYEGNIIKYGNGIGYIKYVADDYSLGFEVELIAGSNFYSYEGEHYDWGSVEVIGNIYESDLIEKYKYGVTASFKPVSRESAKKKFVNVVKKGWYKRGDWVPTQAHIPENIGIRIQDVVTELRDELVKEGKLIQDPKRYWMCKVPELLKEE